MHARISQHQRHLGRPRLISTGLAILGAGLSLCSSAGSASAGTTVASRADKTLSTVTTLHGVAHNGAGDVVRGRLICASLHVTLTRRPVAILAHAKTRVRGGFILRIRHTAALAAYARKHHGHVNLDLEVYV